MKKIHLSGNLLFVGQSIGQELRALKGAYLLHRPVLLFLIFYCGLLLAFKKTGLLDRPGTNDPSHWAGQHVWLTGVISEPPEPNPRGILLVVSGETLRTETETVAIRGNSMVQIFGADSSFANPGDRISLGGTLQLPTTARISGTFDYASFLQNRNIRTQMFTSAYSVQNLGDSGSHRLVRFGFKIKNEVLKIFQRHLGSEEAAVLSGLVVGSRPRFHPEIKRIFTESGTMHILVASGSNVAFVVGLWYLLMRLLLRLPRRWALASSLPAIFGYVLVAGADPPIVRGGIMTFVGIVAILVAREDRPYHALGLAALALLLPSPSTLFEVGFQMSFLTVFGLIYYLPRLKPNLFLRLVSSSWVAQLWIFPITLSVFKRFFPIGLLSNLLIIPVAEGGLSAGLLLIIVDYVQNHFMPLPHLMSGLAWLVQHYLRIMIELTRFFANHPAISWWMSSPGILWTFGYYLSLLCLVGVKRLWLPRLGCLLGIILMGTGWWGQMRERKSPDQLQITWLDMGRSLVTLIETKQNEKILINLGPREPTDSVERLLMPYLTERGIHSLEALILTGSQEPPAGEIKELKSWIKIQKIIKPDLKPFSVGGLSFTPLTGPRSGSAQTPILLQGKEISALLGKSYGLKVQDDLLERKIRRLDFIQGRFSDKANWREDFVEKIKPKLLIETGFDSDRYPSAPPWKNIPIIVPQKLGFYTWGGGMIRRTDVEKRGK